MARKPAASSSPSGKIALDPSMRFVVLYGPERFLIEEHTRRFIDVLGDKHGGVEQFTFNGETVQPATVLDELRSYGLMQKHKVVVVDNAEVFLADGKKSADEDDGESKVADGGEDEKKRSGLARKLMEKYAEQPVEEATLIMRAATWRKGNLDKAIAKVGSINECTELTAEAAAGWCEKRVAKRYDASIDRDAAELLVTRHGAFLQHLDTELEKLAALAGPGKTITRQMVMDNTVLSREEKFWAIQDAVALGEAGPMLCKLHELMDVSQHDLVPLTWSVADYLRKVHLVSQLHERGESLGPWFGPLQLWSNAGKAAVDWGKRLGPKRSAQLLQQAITTDRHGKSGRGDPLRNLESLLVTIADTVGSPGDAAPQRRADRD